MGRLTDCQAVLTAMDYPAGLKADLTVELVDPIAPWNNGRFRWQIGQGAGNWLAAESGGEADLTLSVALLSQLYFGQRPAKELLKAAEGLRAGERQRDLLAAIFPACRNFISEYF